MYLPDRCVARSVDSISELDPVMYTSKFFSASSEATMSSHPFTFWISSRRI